MTIKCLLWDFGDTLCDERFIWGAGPEWMALYETFDGGIGDDWSTHKLDTPAFAAEVGNRLGMPADDVISFMRERCQHIRFFDFTYNFYLSQRLPQAIVTVNPDLFSEVIVPLHGFDQSADVIVTSWEEGTTDKEVLCRLALERLPIDCEPAEALLIDNKQHNLDDWAKAGGAGYLFTTDDEFRSGIEARLA